MPLNLFAKILAAALAEQPHVIAPVGSALPILQPLPDFSGRPGPVILVILDGWGVGPRDGTNAIHLARKPNWDRLTSDPRTLYTELAAHGPAVGLPGDDDMGNSEVGHNAMGAGRYIDQGASVIRKLIDSGRFDDLLRLNSLIDNVLRNGSRLHLMGLLQTSGVHAHFDHVKALVTAAHRRGVRDVVIHPLSDARDDSPDQTIPLLQELEAFLGSFNQRDDRYYRVADGGGRMWMGMDRYEASWPMVQRAWECYVRGDAELRVRNALQGIEEGRKRSHTTNPGEIDQFLPSFVVVDEGGAPVGLVQDGDSVVWWNFRGDRSIEISRAFEESDFPFFDRGRRPRVEFAGMMLYDGDKQVPKSYLVEMPRIGQTMPEIFAHNGIATLAGAEAQKYGHVTYFFNGNYSGPFDRNLESYFRVDSDDPSQFAQAPWMKARQVTEILFTTLRLNLRAKFVRVNYANPDMVGHTGNLQATVRAIEAVDLELGRLMSLADNIRGVLIVTADHGNADEMVKKGKPSNSHSIHPVPFIVYDPLRRAAEYGFRTDVIASRPTLRNVAPTLFNLVGYQAPQDMERPLIVFGENRHG